MYATEKKMKYQAFGLTIASDIPLPELMHASGQEESPEIEIRLADLHQVWSDLSGQPNQFLVDSDQVIFEIEDVAIYSVTAGNQIRVCPFKNSDEDAIRLLILGTCMGIIMLFRRILPLHGSAVSIEGKAYAIVGESGAGKSTLASCFLNEGFRLVTDDVIAITWSSGSLEPVVTPSYPQQKLWQDSLTHFGLDANGYRSLYGRLTKYGVPVDSQYVREPLPLAGVFELVKTDSQPVNIRPIERLERLHTLFNHTYRNFLIPKLDLMDWHFQRSAQLINQIQMHQLQRPKDEFTVNELKSAILNTVK